MIMMLMAAAAIAATPATEALGRELAGQGFLATLLPLQTAKEADEMVAAHPELTPAEQADLRATARTTAAALGERIFAVVGHAYATSLSEDDLRALVAFGRTPAAAHFRTAQPQVIGATTAALAGVDFKGATLAAFCARTGKACAK